MSLPLFYLLPIKLIVLLSLLIANHVAQAQAMAIKKYLRTKDSTINSIEIFPCHISPTIIAIIYEWQKNWWEGLTIVKTSNHGIIWEATIDFPPQEQSIRTVRSLRLPGYKSLFFEVYGQTHMGNGDYYLYKLVNKKLILVAQTRAVDICLDNSSLLKDDLQFYSKTFKQEALTPKYRDINKDGLTDIELTGTIIITDDTNHPVKSYPCKKALLYSKKYFKFLEDKSKRIGFDKNDD